MSNSDFQSALATLLAEPQSYVVLKMQGQFSHQEMRLLSSKWWEPLFFGYFLYCFVDDSGIGFVQFRDHSFGTRLLSAKKIEAVKTVFLKAFDSYTHTEWELRTFSSMWEAHVYMGMARP